MKSFLVMIVAAAVLSARFTVDAFVPRTAGFGRAVSTLNVLPLPVDAVVVQQTAQTTAVDNALQQGVRSYVAAESAIDTTSQTLSLKERPPPPTKEEIEAKKRNFNLWFWGGGFVAPFIATIYYFGPKFWKY